ncbi:MAG: glycosyltransferase family 4 protein [Bacteroidales bacterium]|jgi:glycosyltransferase involved in cell wall biosynthesis|nr:glycosyltransferase family 4 protein [Bacteroidales bacterium]
MKVSYLVTGSGDSFYCGNCHRDRLYISSVRETGEADMKGISLYLPPIGRDFGDEIESPVFFGAVSTFLREKVKLFEHMPGFMDRILDSPPLLKFAAHKAGTTRVEGFEETTINMIRGTGTGTSRELSRLASYLSEGGKPDIIHACNALIMGLAVQLKGKLGCSLVCSLQNEDEWVDEMAEPYRTEAWRLIREGSEKVDMFISPSNYFKELIIERTGISSGKIKVVLSGLEDDPFIVPGKLNPEPAIGYYSRLSYQNGLDKLIDAYIQIRKNKAIPSLQLHLCGGYTADNKHFIKEQLKKLKENGFDDLVKIYPSFSGKSKQEFFSSIDLMSVPVRKYDAYGLYLLSAFEAGVPVIQPATGAFPEIIEAGGGGLTYKPDTVEKLAETIIETMSNREKIREMSNAGQASVKAALGTEQMAGKIVALYKDIRSKKTQD